MFRLAASLAALCMLVSGVLAQTSSTCNLCSTIATEYKTLRKSTVTIATTYTYTDYSDTTTKTITSGTRTMYRPKETYTSTLTAHQSYYYNEYFTQVRTTTVMYFNPTTTTICGTATPSDYPTPVYCDCQSTVTQTIKLPVTVSIAQTAYTYDRTKTVQPTSYGHTVMTTVNIYVETAYPTVSYIDFTKTLYPTTVTKTAKPFSTPTGLDTFKLEITNDPYFMGDPYLQAECSYYNGCSENASYLIYAYGATAADGSLFSLINNTLYDSANNVPCGFIAGTPAPIYPGISTVVTAYYLACGLNYDNASLIPGHFSIDCFGNLAAYTGDANTFSVYPYGGTVSLLPQPDPVHGYNDTGPGASYGADYVSIKVKKA